MFKKRMKWLPSMVLATALALGSLGGATFTYANTSVEATSSVPTWEAGKVYNGGDQVEFEGVIYQAKWWTQNEKPNPNLEWGVWKVVSGTTDPVDPPVVPPVDPVDPVDPPVVPPVDPVDPPVTPPTDTTIKPWDAGATYVKGDKVTYDGKTFEAKWWNQNQKPDASNEWGVWALVSSNGGGGSTEPETPTYPQRPKDPTPFKVVGYYYGNEGPGPVEEIQFDKLTHINYAFAIPTREGGIRPLENPENAKKVIAEAHKNNVKVLLAVGGWSYDNGLELEPVFVAATTTDEKCQQLTNQIMAMVKEYGFDGVDLDWEHPRRDGNSKYQYENLMKRLSEATLKEGKLLTSAVLAGVNAAGDNLWDAGGHLDSEIHYVDWINVMAYDGGNGDIHSPYSFAVNSLNYWINTRKFAADKVVLGVPFYGRPQWKTYKEILAIDPDAYMKDVVDGMWYNGVPTITKKTELALNTCGGIMIWQISQDVTDPQKSLLAAIDRTVKANNK
nr:glycosyl hydrolase family 18 protein [uncultured Niameybacter sp.]